MGSAGEGELTKTTFTNLSICIAQLLVIESLFKFYPGNHAGSLAIRILTPISFLTLAPIWAFEDRALGAFLAILSLDTAFLSIMIFSIRRNHKLLSSISLFAFNFLCVGLIAAGT